MEKQTKIALLLVVLGLGGYYMWDKKKKEDAAAKALAEAAKVTPPEEELPKESPGFPDKPVEEVVVVAAPTSNFISNNKSNFVAGNTFFTSQKEKLNY
jgi:hypothetical protein